METEGLALNRLFLLVLIVVAFFGILLALYSYGGSPDVSINQEVQCKNTLETNIQASSDGVVKISDECFRNGEPVLNALAGAEPGDSVEKTDGDYSVVEN